MMKRFSLFCLIAWVSVFSVYAENSELFAGNLKLVVYEDTGSFTLYRLSPVGKNRYEPLFDDRNGSSTSWFSVQSNGRIFNLVPRAGKKPVIVADSEAISVLFTPTDDFQVTQRFAFTGQNSDNGLNLSIATSIENTSGKPGDFALKSLIDTNLGENGGIHYRTNLRDRISAETSIDPVLSKDTWIVSADKDSSLMFAFTAWSPMPEKVVIANWERLKTLSWVPSVVEGRSFNTIYSVNDSALLFIWPPRTIGANKTIEITMTLGNQAQIDASISAQTPDQRDSAAAIDRSGTRNQVIERILRRIAEIEQNPGSATDSELIELNGLLDKYLSETGAQ